MSELSFKGVLWRVFFALALVFATCNPSGVSYLAWLAEGFPHVTPLKAVVGLLLLGAWVFFVRSSFTSMGPVGLGLVTAVLAAIAWWMSSKGWLQLGSGATLAWVGLTIVGLVLGFGMSWASIRQKASGQASVDRVDT